MSTIKTNQRNNKRLKVEDFYYARPNVWSELPRKEMPTSYISCLTPSFFTDAKRSVRERMAVVTDSESWELLMSDINAITYQYKVNLVGTEDVEKSGNQVYDILDTITSWIFDEKPSNVSMLSTIDINLTHGDDGIISISHAGSFDMIMDNFYSFITKRTDYRLSHIVTLFDQLIAAMELMFLDPECQAFVDEKQQLRFSPDGRDAVLGHVYAMVNLIVGYIKDMAFELDKELNQIEED